MDKTVVSTDFRVIKINSKRQVKGKLGQVVQIQVCRLVVRRKRNCKFLYGENLVLAVVLVFKSKGLEYLIGATVNQQRQV